MSKLPRVNEFIRFINILRSNAPVGYYPWLLRLNPCGKDPIEGISWKSEKSRVTIEQAIDYMRYGGNIGIAGTKNDNLVNMDCDGGIIQETEVKPTLTVKTRSRVGKHAFYWNIDNPKISNIPTNDAGEVRSEWQFVVAAGSYVETDPNKVPEEEKENAGYYTIHNSQAPVTISFSELPKVFQEEHARRTTPPKVTPSFFDPKKTCTQKSALFEITAYDVALREGGKTNDGSRWHSIFHDSDTQKNMSYSTRGLLHCWRHECSFNGLQALTVLSGYMDCTQAGTPHNGTPGNSAVIGNNGAIFYAWKYAKDHGYIPKDDKIPVKAMYFIAEKHLHFKADITKPLPQQIYQRVLKIVEEKY